MSVLFLVKQGYGSKREVEELDTRDFLNALEFEQIRADIENYHIQQAGK